MLNRPRCQAAADRVGDCLSTGGLLFGLSKSWIVFGLAVH